MSDFESSDLEKMSDSKLVVDIIKSRLLISKNNKLVLNEEVGSEDIIGFIETFCVLYRMPERIKKRAANRVYNLLEEHCDCAESVIIRSELVTEYDL